MAALDAPLSGSRRCERVSYWTRGDRLGQGEGDPGGGHKGREMTLLIGAIADDLTGATDLANTLVRQGMRTVQLIGVPARAVPDDVDAIVVALKTRTIPAPEAVAQSLAALRWLVDAEARQVLFKYCSTFNSTDAGNIGPVADALLDALEARPSPSSAPPSRRTDGPSIAAISLSATCCFPNRACATIR